METGDNQGIKQTSGHPGTNPLAFPTAKGVLCGACERVNPLGTVVCDRCNAALYVNCPTCHQSNGRALSVCKNCQLPLDPIKAAIRRRFALLDPVIEKPVIALVLVLVMAAIGGLILVLTKL